MKNTGCLSIVALAFTAYFSVPVLFGPNEEVPMDPHDKIIVKDCSLMNVNTKTKEFEGAVKKIEEDQSVVFLDDSATVNGVKFFKVAQLNDTGYLAFDELKQNVTTKYSVFWNKLDFQKSKTTTWFVGIILLLLIAFVKVLSIHKSFLKEHS